MKKKYEQFLPLIMAIIIILLIGGYIISKNIEKKPSKIKTTNDIDININTDDGNQDINWLNLEKKYVFVEENITITEAGIYTLTGEINKTVTVNTTGNVKLVLDNVTIKTSEGPAIIIEESENTLIYLSDNTINTLEDSSNYSYNDKDINSVIYSKDDLIFDGNGVLNVNSNYQDGIVSKDDLKIVNGTYNINSIDDGIRGKDSLYIINGNFNITSGGDSLKSTNDTDKEKGYILIENGNFNLESELDGLDAETKLLIKNGTFNIKAGVGNINSNNNWKKSLNNVSSAKGIKSKDNLIIENGVFTLDTLDDSIHSNNNLGIKNGTFNITSSDDGIHADKEIIIDSGNINIEKSYEGLEAAKIIINDGNIKVVSSDDGINVAGGNDSSSMNRPGENNYSNNTDNILTINNGTIYIDSTGDGIDINGSGYIYGGNITVDGPTSDRNTALDYDLELIVDGGTVIAVGSSGMAKSISSNSKQNNIIINTDNMYDGKKISLTKADIEIISYTPSKSYQSVIISSSKLETGKTYTLKIDDEEITTFIISSTTTSIGKRNNMNSERPNNGRR